MVDFSIAMSVINRGYASIFLWFPMVFLWFSLGFHVTYVMCHGRACFSLFFSGLREAAAAAVPGRDGQETSAVKQNKWRLPPGNDSYIAFEHGPFTLCFPNENRDLHRFSIVM